MQGVDGAARGRGEGDGGVEQPVGDGHGVDAGQDVMSVLGGLRGQAGRARRRSARDIAQVIQRVSVCALRYSVRAWLSGASCDEFHDRGGVEIDHR